MGFVEDVCGILGGLGSNRQYLELLSMQCQKLVPFVGAGLSLEFGYPSWSKLLEDLGQQAGLAAQVQPLLAKGGFEEAADLVHKALPGLFDDTLKTTFHHDKLTRPIDRGAVRHLPFIGCGLVLTTNFDRVLEAAFEDAGKRFGEIVSGSQIQEANQAIQLVEPILLKLHGDYWHSDSRILTLSQYITAYGSAAPNEVNLQRPGLPSVLGQVLGSRPLLFLGCSLKLDRTITVISRLARQYPGNRHFALLSDSEITPERRRQLDDWNIRPLFYPKGHREKIEAFLACLAQQCKLGSPKKGGTAALLETILGMEKDAVIERQTREAGTSAKTKPASSADEMVRINGYKLFYFRNKKKLSFADLSQETKLDKDLLRKIEKVNADPVLPSPHCFQRCSRDVINKLEKALECVGKLEAGQADDFLSMYLQHYFSFKGVNTLTSQAGSQFESAFPIRVAVFDFDGTLTIRKGDMTTWEKIWTALGYDINDSADLHTRFQKGEFSHEVWCEMTLKKFKERGFRHGQLKRIAKSISLVPGTRETVEQLKAKGVKLYILSGSIKEIIKTVLGKLWDDFEEIKANEIIFDSSGVISQINGTRFDFEGKATFLKRVHEDNRLSPLNVLFIGNSCNDIWASHSGVRTLCVNPHLTDPSNQAEWTHAIRKMKDLREILKYVGV
jgi:HAD superfamily phosphoserine phosphatase-like hydrolase